MCPIVVPSANRYTAGSNGHKNKNRKSQSQILLDVNFASLSVALWLVRNGIKKRSLRSKIDRIAYRISTFNIAH